MNTEFCKDFRDRLPALAENPLGPEAEPSLLAHIRACPACGAEYTWLTSLCRELEAVGDAAVRTAPAVDLTHDVMKAVARMKQPHLVELAPARARRRFGQAWWIAASAASAAAIVATIWIAGYRVTRPVTPSVAVNTPATPVAPQDNDASRFNVAGVAEFQPGDAEASPFQKLIDTMRPGADSAENSAADVMAGTQASLNINEVLAARKDAVTNPASRLQLARWAELSAQKARELAANEATSMDARVGAADSLPPEEAEKILLAAVAADPNNPYLRYQLGNLYGEDAGAASKAAGEFAAQAQLDPNNALAYYQLAANLFAQGDAQGASSALETAQTLTGAHPYTLEDAGYHEQALTESGVGEEVARLLVALTAGTSQYGDLVGLGNNLLDYGKYYEQNGQPELAEQVYNSVRIFGEQLANNSTFANELLAGLDIQREAVTVLSGLVEFIQEPGNADMLAQSGEQLVNTLNMIGGFFTSLNEFFQHDLGADVVGAFVDYVLESGDLGALDFLTGLQ